MRKILAFLLAACLLVSAAPALALNNDDAALADNWYEIFVYSFADGNGDRIGDFIGLKEKLPYLQSLHVDGIWLMPIHPSPSYHKYDVTDYCAIDPQYGTLADFQAEAPDGRRASAAELTKSPSLLLWLDAGSEPTEHLLNELLASRGRIRALRLVLLLRTRQMLQNEKLRAVLAAFPEAEVWLTADSAEPAARSAYVDPDSLPLLLLCDRPRHIIHAAAGYRIGSIDTALSFCRGWQTESPHRPRAQ